jgi:hypothetical protein
MPEGERSSAGGTKDDKSPAGRHMISHDIDNMIGYWSHDINMNGYDWSLGGDLELIGLSIPQILRP